MKTKLLLSIASVALSAGLVGTAHAGKSDDTLNVAIDRELESIDNYYNTAREGIVISRMVWDGLLYRDPQTNEYVPNKTNTKDPLIPGIIIVEAATNEDKNK